MRLLYLLADHVFRFRYTDPLSKKDGVSTWDVGIYEEQVDKVNRDFFIMGFVIGLLLTTIGAVTWLLID